MALNIQEIRNQYPQYKDIPDKALVDGFYNKFYKEKMPKDQFYQAIDYREDAKGLQGIGEDILTGIKQVPEMGWEALKALPSEFAGFGKQVLAGEGKRIGKNVLYGGGNLAQGLANAPSTTAKYLADKGLIEATTAQQIPRAEGNLGQYLSGLTQTQIENPKAGDLFARGITELPLFLASGGTGLLQKAAFQGGKYGALGAATEQNPITLGLLGEAPRAAIQGVRSGVNKARSTPPITEERLAAQKVALENDIPLTVSNVNPYGIGARIEDIGENLGIKNTKNQLSAAQKAVENITDKYKQNMINDFGDNPNINKKLELIANSDSKRAPAARELIESINDAGEDWNVILKTSGNKKLLLKKIEADKLYNNVEELATGAGDVPLTSSLETLNRNITELEKLPSVNKTEISLLKELMGDISNNNGEMSFSNTRKLRTMLSDKIADYTSGQYGLIGRKGVDALNDVRKAVNNDMEQFVNIKGGSLKDAWKKADSYYKNEVVPYKDKAIAKAFKSETNPDEIYKMFIKNGGAEGDFGTGRAKKFYEALDESGKSAVRYGILKQTYDASINEAGNFSPAKYASNLSKLQAASGTFFKGTAKAEINGLASLMRIIERAGQAKPMTGYRNYPVLAGLGALAFGQGGTAILGYIGLERLLNTKTGKKILLNISTAKEGTSMFGKAVDAANNLIEETIKTSLAAQEAK